MNRDAVMAIMAKIEQHVDYLAVQQAPGSVICEIHCDSSGPRKIVITLQESHPAKDSLARS